MRCRPATIPVILGLWVSPMAQPGVAGPWAREAGEGFLAYSVVGEAPRTDILMGHFVPDTYASLYGEYGLGRGLTLGAQIGRSATLEEGAIFLRYTLTQPENPWQFAFDGGAGLRRDAGGAERMLARLGLSVGRGFGAHPTPTWWMPIAHDGGWVTLDAVGMIDTTTADPMWQLESTLGFSVSDRLRVMLQAKVEETFDGRTIRTLAPGAAWSLTERTTAQIGMRFGLGERPTIGLSLGLWHRF